MEKKYLIEDAQVQTKINNFIKTCNSILLVGKDLNLAQQSKTAYKVLLRFLRNNNELCAVYDYFNEIDDIKSAYSIITEVATKNYTLIIQDKTEESTNYDFKYHVGDIVFLGKKHIRQLEKEIEWSVVKTDSEKALLFSNKVLFWEPFDISGNVDWNNSSVRKKLNTSWLSDTISSEERGILLLNKQDDNSADEFFFLLSNEEIDELVPTIEQRKDRVATWWTTSSGNVEGNVCFVNRDGELQFDGFDASKNNGVRPAVWIQNPRVEIEEIPPEKNTEHQKKIIFIVFDIADYFIAEALDSDNVDSSYLKKFIHESKHYTTKEEAKFAAETIGTYSANYEIEYKEINLNELINQEFERANERTLLYDKHGNPVLAIDNTGTKYFLPRQEESDCLYIDVPNYQKQIDELREIEKEKNNRIFDYETIGRITGFEVGRDCNAPHIHYEIFKAEELIEYYGDYPDDIVCEAFSDDRKYYKGYIEALRISLELQHKHSLSESEWKIVIIDLREEKITNINDTFDSTMPECGHFVSKVYHEIPDLIFEEAVKYIVVTFVDKNKDWAYSNVEAQLHLPYNVPIDISTAKNPTLKSKPVQYYRSLLKKYCTLKSGDSDYTVNPAFVPSLAAVNVDDDMDDDKKYVVENNVEKGKSENKVQNPNIDIRFQNEGTILQPYEFKENTILKSIKMPINLKSIPEGLFYECSSLEYVVLPENIRIINKSVFEGCTELWKIYLPETLKRIEDRAFYGCTGLKKIYLPSKLEHIGSEAFCGCRKITSIYFPASIKTIAEDAFDGCSSLNKVELPFGVDLPSSLSSCSHIKRYAIPKQNMSISGDAYENNEEESDGELLNDTVKLIEYFLLNLQENQKDLNTCNMLLKEYCGDII